jgi:hypothetical protein
MYNKPSRQDARDRHAQQAQAYRVAHAVPRPEDGVVHVRADDTAKLRAGIGQPDAEPSRARAFERADALGPDDGVGGAGARDGDDDGEVAHDGVRDGDEDNVADDGCGFDLGKGQ